MSGRVRTRSKSKQRKDDGKANQPAAPVAVSTSAIDVLYHQFISLKMLLNYKRTDTVIKVSLLGRGRKH